MALERLTQITEVGIQSGITLRNVNVEGAYVSGVVTATSLNVTGSGANFSGVVTATTFVGNVTGNINPSGLVVTGVSTFQASSFWGDGDVAYFGDGQDLLIFHNSTDSIIRDNGTGDLFIEGGNRIKMTNPTGIETYAVFNQDGAVELWFDNSKKFETTGAGVTVTGIITASNGIVVNNGPVLIGSGTSTGTATQPLQVTGGAYISGNLGIGTTNPQFPLDVVTSDTSAYAQYIRMRNSYNDYGFIGFRDRTGSEDLVQIGTQRIAANVGELLLYTNNGSTGQERIRVGAAGTVTLRAAGGAVINGYNADDNQLDIAKLSRMGYATSYRNLIIGKHLPNSTSVAYQSISLNYDPNTNASGSFAGYGNEIFVPNNNQTTSYYTRIKQPNTTNNNFKDLIVFGPNGEIMTPNSPAFFAKCNSSGYVTTSPIQFTSVDVNIGSCYDSSTYRFTAPLAATYYFVATAYINAGNTVNDGGYIRFHVNGGGVQYAYAGPGSAASPNGHLTVTVTKVVTLSANDYVDVRFTAYGTGTYYAGTSETTFAGYLLR